MAINLERLEEFLEDQQKMTEVGRNFLREDPLGWIVSRNRLLRAALLNGDENQLNEIVGEVSAVIGRQNADRWKIYSMGKLVEQEIQEIESKP